MAKKCECGKWYSDTDGVEMCKANRHGSGKDSYADRYLFEHTLEIHIDHECAECGEILTSRRHDRGGNIVFRVSPHRCQTDEPE